MIEPLVKSIENAFVQFNFRRLLYLAFMFSILAGGLWLFDNATGYSYYARLDKRVDAMERLQQMQKGDISEEMIPVYDDVVRSLVKNKLDPSPVGLMFNWLPVLKFFSASVIFWMVCIVGIVGYQLGKKDWNELVVGAIVFAIPLGFLGVIVPIIYSIWVNITMYIIGQVFVVFAISKYGNSISKA